MQSTSFCVRELNMATTCLHVVGQKVEEAHDAHDGELGEENELELLLCKHKQKDV